jgi:DNA-binding NtrC family response regulator
MRPRLFVVDDEPVLLSTLAAILNLSGYTAISFATAEETLLAAEADPPSILLCDVHLSGMNGVELAILFKTRYPSCKIALLSGSPETAELLVTAKSQGHEFQVLAKPIHPTDLLAAIEGR